MSILFIISPFISIILYTILLYKQETITQRQIWFLATMLSIYLGLLNTTKELLGDFYNYYNYFIDVGSLSLVSYILEYGKEPVYTIYTYISYYLFAGSWDLYVISITTIYYLLISYSIITVGKHLKSNHKDIILTLFIMAFFFQQFAVTSNLMRQAPSSALALVFLTRLYIYKKKNWWIALIALLTHTSCLPIIGIGIAKVIQEKFNIKNLLNTIILIGVFIFVFVALESVLSNIPFIGYIYSRATDENTLYGTDSWQTDVGFNIKNTLIIIIFIFMALYIYFNNKNRANQGIGVVNINIVLITMLFLFNAMGSYYLFMRYFFYIYTFYNVLIMYFLSCYKYTQKSIIRASIIIMMIVYFFYNYTHNIFSYNTIIEAILYPIPIYFI